MPKLKPDAIKKCDLIEFLESSSDFSFELSTLKMLRESGLSCEHGGLYEDPVTKKSREYDIRAVKTISNRRVRLAIECKNIRENFPILISCVPRHKDESFHQIALVSEPDTSSLMGIANFNRSRAKTLSMKGKYSIYRADEPVGKSTIQVGRSLDGHISVNDGDLYDKWSQALSSVADLADRIYWDGDEKDEKDDYLSAIFPIIVVPDSRLWYTLYDNDGNRIEGPSQTERCSSFVNKDYEVGSVLGTRIWVSHLEIMTYSGLKEFVESHLKSPEGMQKLFPEEGLIKELGFDFEDRI